MKKTILFIMLCAISILSAQIPNDYVAFYEFTNNSNANSATGNTYPLTNIDVACQYTDRFNNANSAYIPNCGNENNGYRLTANNQLITDYSISFWYKSNVTNNTTNRQIISFKEVNSTSTFAFSFRRVNNLYYVFVNYGGITINANLHTTSNLLNDGNWHNIVLSIDGFGVNNLPNGQNINQYDATLYVDNVLHTSASSTLDAIDNNDPYYGTHGLPTLELIIAPIILNHQNGGDVADSIDDILVYDRAISQSEVNNIYNATSSTCTNIVNIPDANFKAALLNHGVGVTGAGISVIDTDGDGEICQTEAQAYTGKINVYNKHISDLTGIEAFTALTVLHCGYNQLSGLNVNANTALTELHCSDNSIVSLDVSANTALTKLYCSSNSLTSLDVSTNTALTYLSCANNQLTSLDVSANTALTELECINSQLTSLNVANGNNTNMTSMRATSNPNLTCIQTDANIVGTNPSGWQKDATASYSANCSASTCSNFVNIPDANFKNALVNHSPSIDTDGDGKICQSEAQAFTGVINVSSKSISDLTGIEAFTNITSLDCSYNDLTSLDISSNTNLTQLNCNDNELTTLNTNGANNLTRLFCFRNQLASLELSTSPLLNRLDCYNNKLASLNVSTNSNLTDLYCNKNLMTTLNLPTGANLEILRCNENQLSSLDVSQNTALIILNCSNNQLSSLDVSTNTDLKELYCNYNQLSSLNTSANTDLTRLYCKNNQLTSLNIANGNNTNMTGMWAHENTNLTCIQTDADIVGTTPNGWQKDNGATYSANCATASINDITFNNTLQMYPNPVTSILTIGSNRFNIKQVEIYNVLGKKVLNSSNKNIDVSNLAKGIYLIKIQSTEGKFATKKFIKN